MSIEMRQTEQVPQQAEPMSKPQKYAFFSFQTSDRLASEYGHCSGQVNLQTGGILATITYGLFHYREERRLNINDPVSLFAHTEEQIIREARRAVKTGGYRMTRRRVIFVRKDGRRYITEEFNGDKSEFAAHGDCLDGCDLDWPEIRAIFHEASTYPQFIKANLKAQAAYHSFLGEDGNTGTVCNLRKGRPLPSVDAILFIYERPLENGVRFVEKEVSRT